MPFKSQKASLKLTQEDSETLSQISRSRTEPAQRVERAQILLAFDGGENVSSIARRLGTSRPRVSRCIDRALELGPLAALEDLRRSGRPPSFTSEAVAWVVSLACQKPKDLGYSYELWTTRLLSQHIREHCHAEGHPSLSKIARGTVSKILSKHEIKPHKIRYYLERRDPDFDRKMIEVLLIYREVEVLREKGGEGEPGMRVAYLSYDEKPGMQALRNVAPDRPPVPGDLPTFSRDPEYVRDGTWTLMAGIDLLTGHVHGQVVPRHRSREFIEFLRMVDKAYPPGTRIKMVLDNHSAHTSKETRAYLKTVPNRFEFIFTPKHGSWLNLIEMFFSKMARTLLRGIRVGSREELKSRIEQYLLETNEIPVPFRWKYGLDELT